MNTRYLTIVFCLMLGGMASPAFTEEMRGAHVVVSGPAKRVLEFQNNLKAIVSAYLVDGNLGNAGVACSFVADNIEKDCDNLSNEQPERSNLTLEYVIYRDQERLTAFVAAWAKMQDQDLSSVTMSFDMIGVTAGDCLNPEVAKQPCTNATWCPNTFPKRCDKAAGPPCSSCGVP